MRQVTVEHQRAVEDVTVLGHGVGAVIVATWVHDYAPRVRAMVLAAPGFRDPIPASVLADLRGTSDRLLADAAAIHAPTLLLDTTADRRSTVVARDVFFARLASARKVRHRLEGPGASLLGEPAWTQAADAIRRSRPRWSVNGLALAAVGELLGRTDLPGWAREIAGLRAEFAAQLTGLGAHCFGCTPKLLVRVVEKIMKNQDPAGVIAEEQRHA